MGMAFKRFWAFRLLGLKVKILQVFGQFPNFFIGFGRKSLIVPTVNLYSTHRAYKNSQEIDLKVLKTSKILIFNPKII